MSCLPIGESKGKHSRERIPLATWKGLARAPVGQTVKSPAPGWLRGWIDAACEHDPALIEDAGDYLRRRLDQLAAGTLRAEVGHVDVLAEFPRPRPAREEP